MKYFFLFCKIKSLKSEYLLAIVFILVAVISFIFIRNFYSFIEKEHNEISLHKRMIMDENSPDPGKTAAVSYEKPKNIPKVKTGIYFERIESLAIKNSQWTGEFYLWFTWNQSEVDFLGIRPLLAKQYELNTLNELKLKSIMNELNLSSLPISVINGEIESFNEVSRNITLAPNELSYVQFKVKAQITQFFDVTLFPIDAHDLLVSIEHAWLNRQKVLLVPDTNDTKISSRVSITGYKILRKNSKIIEKPHAYKSARGNPNLPSGFKVDFSQIRMSVPIKRGGIEGVFKLFLIVYVAVIVAFLGTLAKDPSRFVVGSLFTAAGSSIILSSKLPTTDIITLAEFINGFALITIIIIIIVTVLISIITKADGVITKSEKYWSLSIYLLLALAYVILNYSALSLVI